MEVLCAACEMEVLCAASDMGVLCAVCERDTLSEMCVLRFSLSPPILPETGSHLVASGGRPTATRGLPLVDSRVWDIKGQSSGEQVHRMGRLEPCGR